MGKQRLKRIQAGRLVREVLWTPTYPCDSPKAREVKGRTSSAVRRAINQRHAWQRLKLLLAANFTAEDLHVVLTYDNEHLPPNREAARKLLKRLLTELRAARRQSAGLRYVYNIEGRHGDKRLHHHIVLNAAGNDYETIRSLWKHGNDIDISRIDEWGYEELAKYLTKEAREGVTGVGSRSYVPSRNLVQPEEPPAEWVPAHVRLEAPLNAQIICSEQ